MIITISGRAGSGKSTIGRLLAKKLHCKFYSMGDVRRKMAREMGLTILQLNRLAEKDPSSDVKVDRYQSKLAKKEKKFVIDSRLGYLFIPESIKIFLDADINVRAKRIFKDSLRGKEEKTLSALQTKKELIAREKSDIKRYRKLYRTNPYEPKHYDLLVNTTKSAPAEIIRTILKYLKLRKL